MSGYYKGNAMSLSMIDHFYYDPELATYDFTVESESIRKLRELSSYKTVLAGETPLTVIAFREYGDHTLWWVLAAYNSIVEVDSIGETSIDIPSLSEVRRVLS